jgi:hypothetical protein
MSLVLVLFVVALIIMLVGLFLSPRPQSSSPRNEAPVTSKNRRVVKPASGPERVRRFETPRSKHGYVEPMVERATSQGGSMNTERITRHVPISTDLLVEPVALRARAGTSNLNTAPMRQRPGAPTGSASLAYPKPDILGDLLERLGSWKVGVPGLIAVALLGLYLLSTVLVHPLLWTAVSLGTSPNTQPPSSSHGTAPYAASQHLIRLSQLDPAQYASTQEFNTWAYSACSAAAMTEVINSYGHNYRITNILEIEAAIHEITPQLGLLEEVGIQRTGAKFGFKTTWGHNLSLDQVIAAANSGTPVIVSFPPAKFPGGHVLVVRGGDSTYVYLADSSRLDWTELSHARFLQLWGGFSAIMTPA